MKKFMKGLVILLCAEVLIWAMGFLFVIAYPTRYFDWIIGANIGILSIGLGCLLIYVITKAFDFIDKTF